MYSRVCVRLTACMCVRACVVHAHVVLKRTASAEQQQVVWLWGSGVHFKTDALAHRLHVVMCPLIPDTVKTVYCVLSAFSPFLIRLRYARRLKGSGRLFHSDGQWRIRSQTASTFSSPTLGWFISEAVLCLSPGSHLYVLTLICPEAWSWNNGTLYSRREPPMSRVAIKCVECVNSEIGLDVLLVRLKLLAP